MEMRIKTIQLRFRQRKGAQLVLRVLGGNHKKRVGQGAGGAFHRHLLFLHAPPAMRFASWGWRG